MIFRKVRILALGAVAAFALQTAAAQAALITQTIDFTFSDFQEVSTFAPGPIGTVTGTVSFTFDDATPVSIFGQAVDGISFTTPSGVFDTGDVFFDLRIGPDTSGLPSIQYELDIYHDTLPVFLGSSDDFLLRMASVQPVGAPFAGSAGTAALFHYSDVSINFFGSNQQSLDSTSEPVVSAVSAPASLAFLGLGMLAIGLTRRHLK